MFYRISFIEVKGPRDKKFEKNRTINNNERI